MNPTNLSAPIFVLKRQAKALILERDIPLNEALDVIAQREGAVSWSMLAQRSADLLPRRLQDLYGYLNPGDLVLIGSRPGAGKTLLACRVMEQAIKAGANAGFYSLAEPVEPLRERIAAHGVVADGDAKGCWLDCSDDICAEYIEQTSAERLRVGSILVIDYLQMLDERRAHAPLQDQVEALSAFAKRSGCIVLFLCQLDRAVHERRTKPPSVADIRLPNPLDLGLFNKIVFLNRSAQHDDGVELHFAEHVEAKFAARVVANSAKAYHIEDWEASTQDR